jgi:type IX secretion system PorP/SprF family membrane protein
MKRILYILLFVFLAKCAFAQDTQFTQFYASPLYLAPSYAGGIPGHRVVANYRNQWSFVPGTFQSFSFSYDHNFINFKSGLGFLALGDIAGDGNLGTTLLGVLYSYDITPSPEWHIRPGVGFYYVQQGLNFSRLIFGDQLTTWGNDLPPSVQRPGKGVVRDIDVSTSVLAYSDNIWVGATWDHMLKPERSFYGEDARTPYKFSLFGGMRIVLRGFILRPIEESVTAAFNIKTQGDSRQADLGVYWYRQPFLFGTWYRGIPLGRKYSGSDAVAFLFGYRFDQINVAYSYDFTVSKLGFGSGGSHEIAFIYTFTVKTKKRWRAMPCPAF